MDTDKPGLSTPTKRTILASVPGIAIVVGLATNVFNIFGMLGITEIWQRRIVFTVLASVAVVLELLWVFRGPISGDSGLAHFSRTRRRRLALAAGPTVLVGAGLVWAVHPFSPEPRLVPRVAVLEFRDGSPRRDQGHVASGLTDALELALENTPGIAVYEPDSASVVIHGLVSQWKDVLEVTAKLVRNPDKRRLRSVRFKEPADSLQTVRDSLSQRIVTAFLPEIQASQAKAAIGAPHVDPRAYDLYLRARYARDRERNVPKADSLFRAALAADSSFARARRELAALQPTASQ